MDTIRIVAVALIILGLWCGMKKHAWSEVRGHSRDYMAKRARRKGRLEKDGAIQLDEFSRGGQEAFSDEVSFHHPRHQMIDADTKSSLTKEGAITLFEKKSDASGSKMTV